MSELTLPLPVANGRGTRELVVSLLGSEWPLGTKEIFSRLKRTYAFEGTYQAVHKAVSQALQEGVLSREGKGYALSREWIGKVKQMGSDLDSNYSGNGNKIDPNNFEGSAHLKFDNFLEFTKWLVNEYSMKFPNPEKKNCICIWEHAYSIIGATNEEHENLKKLFAQELHYGLCRNDTFMDRWCSDYVSRLGKKCVTGYNYSAGNDTFIQGDFIMFVFVPPEFKNSMDALYKKIKCADDIDMNEYFDTVLKPKVDVHALIVKNPALAEKFRREAKAAYERKGVK
ncbi:MAG: hypothetical protein V1676_02600 [Candidatus Diapherotrites archaeon]